MVASSHCGRGKPTGFDTFNKMTEDAVGQNEPS